MYASIVRHILQHDAGRHCHCLRGGSGDGGCTINAGHCGHHHPGDRGGS